MARTGTLVSWRSATAAAAAALALLCPPATRAQSEGGLYIAGNGFSFQQAAQRGIAQNPRGRRFFVLAVPPETAALLSTAPPAMVTLRERVVAANGALLVCQRDIGNGRVNAANLAPGVVPVRGWPPKGSNELPSGQRYFANENRANLPASNEALRRLRSTCS
jgi:hypothetical protein